MADLSQQLDQPGGTRGDAAAPATTMLFDLWSHTVFANTSMRSVDRTIRAA
jgi:hypothetical protein